MPINFSLPGMIDLRSPIAGDSFSWSGIEPAAAKKSLVIHHSASPNNQDGFDIAAYHVNHNGWGGIGYHFVITHDDYKGRPGATPAGAQIQYVGDLLTWRAHVENANPGRVGICLVGNFVDAVPGPNQLRLARQLIDFFIDKNNVLPSINFYSQVTGHGLIPGQQTSCPGYANPNFSPWFGYLQGGGFPDGLYAPAPTPPPPPAPEPAPTPPSSSVEEVPVPVKVIPGGVVWEPLEAQVTYVVQREGAFAKDALNNVVLDATRANLTIGTNVAVAGFFTFNGERFVRTVYATAHDTWTGVPAVFFQLPDVQPPEILEPEEDFAKTLENGFLDLPADKRPTFWQLLSELGAITLGPVLRLLGILKNKGKS